MWSPANDPIAHAKHQSARQNSGMTASSVDGTPSPRSTARHRAPRCDSGWRASVDIAVTRVQRFAATSIAIPHANPQIASAMNGIVAQSVAVRGTRPKSVRPRRKSVSENTRSTGAVTNASIPIEIVSPDGNVVGRGENEDGDDVD